MNATNELQQAAAGGSSPAPGITKLFGTKRDLAALVGVSQRTINAWLAKGLPHLKTSKRQVRINLVEAAAWIESQFRTVRFGKAGHQ